jgi:hypothetical protein
VHRRVLILTMWFTMLSTLLLAQAPTKDWCRALPRPEYKALQHVPVTDPWFEVYEPVPAVFAIYEPHQAEETIGYLIVGKKSALLFDTGMGISDIKKVTAQLTQLPIVVLNSHTHDDHVGGNWQFDTVYGMDTDFTRKNALGSREDAQAEITSDQICGALPKEFDSKAYATRPWKITKYTHDGDRLDLGGRVLEIIATPGPHPTLSRLSIAPMACCSRATPTIPHQSGFSARRPISRRTQPRSAASMLSHPTSESS